jgi:acyl-coenzyme A synthetase/AMP-(fatty) acid ligase
VVVDDLPRSQIGKVLRRSVRDRIEEMDEGAARGPAR